MRAILLFAALALGACGDNLEQSPRDAGGDDATADGPSDASEATTGCVDEATQLPRPPTSALPCELVPPGVVLGAQ